MNFSLFPYEEGVIDCYDLALFQLSLLGKEGGGNLKYA